MKRLIALAALAAAPAFAQDLTHLRSLLDATPVGGWVNASASTNWSTVWPSPRYTGDVGSVVYAWGSMVWDSTNGQFILWGGGHANYAGNEVYTLSGATGQWARGSLPSAYQSGTSWIVGNGAPQSSHTYDNSQWLPISQRFVTFGGAAWNSGSNFDSAAGREGPWLWNPALADPNRVGGQDFTGLNPTALGSNAWQSRRGSITGTLPPTFVEAATGYRAEGGRDVVYIAGDTGASGFPSLYRYEFNLGGQDIVQQVGVMGAGQFGYEGTATLDTQRGWMVRTLWGGGGVGNDLAVWDLDRNNPGNPSANASFAVRLQRPDGTPYSIVQPDGTGSSTGLTFEQISGHYFLFRGQTLNEIIPGENPDGTPSSVWTVIERPCAGACPDSTGQPVLGHLISIPELGAVALMAGYQSGPRDVDVWLYRAVAEVPEPGTWLQLAAGLAVLGGVAARRRIHG